jgi:hypothetical protein
LPDHTSLRQAWNAFLTLNSPLRGGQTLPSNGAD